MESGTERGLEFSPQELRSSEGFDVSGTCLRRFYGNKINKISVVSFKNFVLHADLPVSAKIASSVLYPHQRLNYKQIATIPQKIMLNNNYQFQTLLILEKYEQI